ncbi:MAG: sugar phosphate isomerase/epimerase [Oscillibacter sp.]|nr:sugar phosphate isomerase/epimerase [Oscillibacter sp.]
MSIANSKISCLPVSLFQDFFDRKFTLEDWASYAAELGMDYVDINRRCLLDMSVSQAEAVRGKLARPIMMVTTYSDFTNPDPAALNEAVEAAKVDIALCEALGAKYLRLTAGQDYPNQRDEDMIERIYRCFETCVPLAQKAGLGLLLENHSKPGAWTYVDYDFHFDHMLKLWEKLKALPIGVNFDTANGFALKDWKTIADAFGDRIETVHINDLASVEPLKFSLVGEGIVPQIKILAEVFRLGFHGPICIEEAGFRGKEGIAAAYQNTKTILRELENELA